MNYNLTFGREINCPFCGRPFVDWDYLSQHIHECRKEAQRKLDENWQERMKPMQFPEIKP